MAESKKSITEVKYRLGSNNRYPGLLKHVTERVNDFSEGSNSEWRLQNCINTLKESWVEPYLKQLDLPCTYHHQTAVIDPESGRERKLGFRKAIDLLAEQKGLSGHEKAIARNAAAALDEYASAEGQINAKRFEKAAVHIARATPYIAFLTMLEMEAQWHNGQSYQQGNKPKAKRDRKPLLKAIYIRLAKRACEPRDLWSEFVTALREETWHDQTAAFDEVKASEPSNRGIKHWYVSYRDEIKNRNETVSYETFRTTLGRHRRKLKT